MTPNLINIPISIFDYYFFEFSDSHYSRCITNSISEPVSFRYLSAASNIYLSHFSESFSFFPKESLPVFFYFSPSIFNTTSYKIVTSFFIFSMTLFFGVWILFDRTFALLLNNTSKHFLFICNFRIFFCIFMSFWSSISCLFFNIVDISSDVWFLVNPQFRIWHFLIILSVLLFCSTLKYHLYAFFLEIFCYGTLILIVDVSNKRSKFELRGFLEYFMFHINGIVCPSSFTTSL